MGSEPYTQRGPVATTGVAAPPRHRDWWRGVLLLLALALGAGLGWLIYGRLSPRPVAHPIPPRWPVTVSTMAGGGTPGISDGVASGALFSDPFGVVVDAEGNTYVTDAGDNNKVRRIAPGGAVTLVAGGEEGWRDGTGDRARFNTPSGIALAPDGTLVVADTGNNAIRRITPDGLVTTIAGGPEAGFQDGAALTARFDAPLGVTVAGDGTIFVADTYNDAIRRISPDGTVTTFAGGMRTGFRDGKETEARFDTPSGIATGPRGLVFVADTGNNVIRRIDPAGTVTTVGYDWQGSIPAGTGSPLDQRGLGSPLKRPVPLSLWQPVGLAVGASGEVYVSDGWSRIAVLSPDGTWQVIAGSSPGFADGAGARARFNRPSGLGVDARGVVRVADSENYLVRALTPPGVPPPARDFFLSPLPLLSPAALGFEHVPWPVDPQEGWHEVTATLGEARGRFGGDDGRERLHAGLDVHAAPGTLVRAVHDEKVSRPIAATGWGDLNENARLGLVSYVHVKVGRDARDLSLDRSRFTVVSDENGAVRRIRLRRGTRFRLGDGIGTVNRFAHVHLGLGPQAAEVNLLRFSLAEFGDHVPPTIPANGVWLLDEAGTRLNPLHGRVDVAGRVAIVADAWDQVDRNRRRRRLGLYSLGYQVLHKDGTPAIGFDEPRITLRFDRLPQAPRAAALAYAQGSGITVYGNRRTRFLYLVTNEVQGGEAKSGWWDTTRLAPGDYRLRVIARDIKGNAATREIAVRVVRPAGQGVPD